MTRSIQRLERFERATDLPMLLLAVALIPLLLAPLVGDLSASARRTVVTADWLIWALFAGELSVKVYLAPARRMYVARHWYDVALVVLPFLRPLRALRLLRLARLVVASARVGASARRIARRRGVTYTLGLAVVACVVIATGTTLAEREADGASINGLADGLWWAATTVTTVGYGNLAPVTPLGRALAFLLMLIGIGAFGVITASIAAFLVEEGREEDSEVLRELRRITDRLDAIERPERGR